MPLNRHPLNRRNVLALGGAALCAPLIGAVPTMAAKAQLNEDGLHVQPWFADTFLDLRDDLKEAAAAGKRLAIFWEQRGCPYCKEMHEVNLAKPDIVNYIKKNLMVIQLNLYGAREVTDFNGKTMEERQLARAWRVNFTPTISFLPATLEEAKAKSAGAVESWRLTGYWKPFHFKSTFVYVKENGYETEPNFQRWLSKYADKLRAQGKEVKLW